MRATLDLRIMILRITISYSILIDHILSIDEKYTKIASQSICNIRCVTSIMLLVYLQYLEEWDQWQKPKIF